jgi:hypothetical protein
MTPVNECFVCAKPLPELPQHIAGFVRIKCGGCLREATMEDVRKIVAAQMDADKKRPGKKREA